MTDFLTNLGRKVEHDDASWEYRSPYRKIIAKKNKLWTNTSPILDQGNVSSCVGNTAAEWLNCTVAAKNRRAGKLLKNRTSPSAFLKEVDANNIYATATQLDEFEGTYPPDDFGTSGLGAAKALVMYEFITAYLHTFTFESFLATVQAQPVMIGVPWYSGMMETDRDGYVAPAPKDTNPVGGHEVLVRGIDWTNSRIQCRNHWTKAWGRQGEFFMRFSVIERLLAEGGDVIAPVVML